ncbi:hypothetical protein C427_3770 [Paraglaciecola psychrophila 170]|uniref:Uncharacterized protein n=1 Tax=Paraglaciecola psychrophila 170 TaxID=1129794 RepID=K6ZNH1_9ALTE|nr:hypothetical protein C427_3770 [Paraglaciecola psychrophila 170]GAC37501.1 hypothetical protein GPSY_1877 [Paraglaciecola psychrophila 170]
MLNLWFHVTVNLLTVNIIRNGKELIIVDLEMLDGLFDG